jgi:hypothetical protein
MYYRIIVKANPRAIYAVCSSYKSAEDWLKSYDPHMWMDKTVQASDLRISPSKTVYGDELENA